MNKKKNPHISETTWEDLKKELFTPTEIAENDLRCAIICEIIRARNELGLSQKELENLSGVKQHVIARMERGNCSPNISTLLKLLVPFRKKLAIVPLDKED